jgi:PAS domain S-box-containing protein
MMDKPRILVVEDESIVAIDLSHTLNSLGYEVVGTVGTGEEALKVLKEHRPDLVLMDIQLRGELDGIQVAEKIQTTLRIPVIYLSAYSDAKTLSRAKLTEPYGYIMKSFDHNDLHSTIEMALYRHKIEKQVVENERLLSTTFATISDGVLTCDPGGKLRLVNAAARRLIGLDHGENLDIPLKRLPVSIENEFDQSVKDPFDIMNVQVEDNFSGRYFITTPAGRFPILCTISPIRGERDEVTGYVYILRNIEEEYQVQEMQSRLASIVETSEDAIIGSSPDGTIISWNKGAHKHFGYGADEVAGKNLSILVPDFYPNEIPEMLDRIRHGEIIEHYETLRRSKSDEILDMSVKISAIRDSEGHLIAVSLIARDMSKRKQLEKEILEIQDRERSRIGQDLHDSLGQQLTGILLRMKAHEGKIAKFDNDHLFRDVQQIQLLVRDAIGQTREMAKGLIPITLQTNGLVEALQELTLYCQSMYGIATSFEAPDVRITLALPTELQLYHIAQEALNNAIKHSGSQIIMVSLRIESTELILSVADRGIGLAGKKSGGLGLRIMQYRANMMSGHLSILQTEEGGTAVICRVPMPGPSRGDS